MFLSGGDGFQSTQVMARSHGSGAKTSTAITLGPSWRSRSVTSSS
jgi:hypothetical protein